MPPASDDVGFAEHDRLRAAGDRLHARGAGLVDRLCRHRFRQPGAADDLSRGIGSRAGLAGVPDQHLVDLRRVDSRRVQGRARRDRPELGRMHVRNAPP